ncbi:MAG: DUF3854 domain-containing protein [Phormidesmis sp. CAN_BIN44]|nr:DUF3854 domain-containing protein [Phormidesmis sp. CAN_BIN44]
MMTPPKWAIPKDLLEFATKNLIDDADLMRSDIQDALGRKVSRWQWKTEHRAEAIAAHNEDGSFFQLRYLSGSPDGRRYDAASQSGALTFFADIPQHYRALINQQQGTSAPLTGSFWDWVAKDSSVPVCVAESFAKSLSLIGIGRTAIAGFGAFGGVEKNEYREFKRSIGKRKSGKKGGVVTEKVPIKARLSKGLSEMAINNRDFILIPDMDANPKTRRTVAIAFLHQARLLEARGCNVKIAFWNSKLGKGIDDVLKFLGAGVVHSILNTALSPLEFELKIESSFDLAVPNAIINSRDMQIDAPELPKEGLVFSDAIVGTGKTKLAARETAGNTLLAPYSLRSLASTAAERLDAVYRNLGKKDKLGIFYDRDVLADRLTTCYASLGKIDTDRQFYDGLDDLLLDEISHGLRDASLGRTCKQDRLLIIDQLVKAIRTSKRVIALDADLTRTELDIIRSLRPGAAEFYLKNLYKPDPWSVSWLPVGNVSEAIAFLSGQVKTILSGSNDGAMIHWASDSRDSTFKISAYLETLGIKSAVVNADTLADKTETLSKLAVAGDFEKLKDLGVQVIITSPSVIQGLSWEEPGRFAAVIGTFSGCSITPRQMRQALSRVRESVPRCVWASEHRRKAGTFGNETSASIIRKRISELVGATAFGCEVTIEQTETRTIGIDAASRLIAQDNLWSRSPRTGLKVLLEEHGHIIEPVLADKADTDAFKDACESWESAGKLALLNAEILTEAEFKLLSDKSDSDGCTRDERLSMRRYSLCRFYGIIPECLTLQEIERDDDGRFRAKVKAFEAIFAPDGEELSKHYSGLSLGLADVDIDRSSVALAVRKAIGLPDLIELFKGGAVVGPSPELLAWNNKAFFLRGEIKTALNQTVMEDAQPMKVAGYLLDQLGLKLKGIKKRGLLGGVSWREYTLDQEVFDSLLRIAETRYEQGIDRVSDRVPQGSKTSYTDPCGTDTQSSPNTEGEGDTGDKKEKESQNSPDWFSPESLEAIKKDWFGAETTDQERAAWRRVIPIAVLERAIA